LLSPSLAKISFRQLDAGVEASGPHDLAVRFRIVRYRYIHVHRIPPRVRDDREPPLRWDETARIDEVIWVGRKAEIFLQWGLDTPPKSHAGRGVVRRIVGAMERLPMSDAAWS
jgi:hypothetical protein